MAATRDLLLAIVGILVSSRCEALIYKHTRERRAHQTSLHAAAASFQELDKVERVFCLSDLHTDHVVNQQWLSERMARGDLTERDLLVVAGDISHELDVLTESLEYLTSPRCQVLFVVGNHEAWRKKKDTFDSIEKINKVYDICRKHGVIIDPCFLPGKHPLWIVPIQSWYDGSLTFSQELCDGFEYWPWVDFARCKWPRQFKPKDPSSPRVPTGLVEYFLEQNQAHIDDIKERLLEQPASVMTVSHFLPNFQSLPDWVDLDAETFDDAWLDHGAPQMSAKFAKVAGSEKIDHQVRQFLPNRLIHIFGHSHRPKDFEYKNVRYIHNPLGKPRERQLYMANPVPDFQLVWTSDKGEVASEQVIRYWDEKGGGKEALWRRMETVKPGRYQKETKR